ncbi:hypothetical protein Droror1_Dr00011354 [Drosera rotundifolia]
MFSLIRPRSPSPPHFLTSTLPHDLAAVCVDVVASFATENGGAAVEIVQGRMDERGSAEGLIKVFGLRWLMVVGRIKVVEKVIGGGDGRRAVGYHYLGCRPFSPVSGRSSTIYSRSFCALFSLAASSFTHGFAIDLA